MNNFLSYWADMVKREPWELKLAWQEIWQVRGCPPDELLSSPPPDPELQRHLDLCPFCAGRMEDLLPTGVPPLTEPLIHPPGPEAAPGDQDAGSASRSHDAASPKDDAGAPGTGAQAPPPRPGQLRSLRRSLGSWGPRGRYYNPPMVLVTGIPEGPPQAVRVAQVHHQEVLASPADVPLGHGLFAEAWNTYTLRAEDLDQLWETIPDATLKEVTGLTQQGFSPVPATDAPWIEAFQRLEMEVGAFFALRALGALLGESQASPSDLILLELGEISALKAHLRASRPEVALPQEPPGVLETLALARFPEHGLPLAASGDENRILLNRAHWGVDGLDLSPMTAEITFRNEDPGGLTFGGVLDGESPEGSELRVWWDLGGEAPIPAGEVSFAPGDGFFRARFQGLTGDAARRGRPLLLLCLPRPAQSLPGGGS